MRAYIIDSKEQDISYIPINSFVYNDGCGFIKRKNTTDTWNDADFERIYCTDNESLNPVIRNPEDELLLKDAEIIKFVVDGSFDFGKGATITEITFKDILGNNIPYDMNNFEDISLANSTNWDLEDNFEGDNLFNGNIEYTDEASGKISSTIFNTNNRNLDEISTFYIRLTPEQMQIIDSIEIIAGSPEGRIPQSIAVYAVKNKDNPETLIETLVFFKAFSMEVDGMRPAQKFTATQKVGADDPCYDLFLNGLTEDGVHLVMNPYTGLLTTIYCDFPDIIEYKDPNDPDFSDFISGLCVKDPKSLVIVKDKDGNFSEQALKDFFISEDWACYEEGCNQYSGTQYTSCMKNLCVANERNPLTTVKYYTDTLKEVSVNVADYLTNNNFVCENKTPVFYDTSDNKKTVISNLDKIIYNGDNDLITVLNPATGEKIKMTALEYKSILVDSKVSEYDKLLEEGWIPDFKENCIVELTNPITKEVKIVSKPNCIPNKVAYPHTASNTTPEDTVDLSKFNFNLNTLEITDSLGAITWEIDDKLIEEPVKDENGNPTLDGETKLTQSIKISMSSVAFKNSGDYGNSINSGDSGNFGDSGDSLELKTTTVTVSDGTKTFTFDVDIAPNSYSIYEPKSINKPFTLPLERIDKNNYKKIFEYDEPGVVLKYYGEITPTTIDGYSDNLIVEITPDKNKTGLISIKPNVESTDIPEGWISENLTISSGDITYNLEIIITKHMRIGSLDNKDIFYNLNEIIVDNGSFNIPIFNSTKLPKAMNPGQMYGYLQSNQTSPSNKAIQPLDTYTGSCVQYGASMNVMDDLDNNNQSILKITPLKQQLNERKYYIIDPYFNEENVKKGIINKYQVYTVAVKYTVNKFLTIDYKETKKISIDKYRFNNSKTNFNLSQYDTSYSRDFEIEHQAPGLNIDIENKNICGLAYGKPTPGENMYWSCRTGGPRPKLFRITTGEQFTELGSTNIRVFDTESEINFTVEVQQFIDIVLPWNEQTREYSITDQVVGGSGSFQLLHPWNHDWNNIMIWASDDNMVELNLNLDEKRVELNYLHIGEVFIFVSDRHRTHKIKLTIGYDNVLTTDYSTFRILENDFDWKYVNILNSQGTLELNDDFNSDLIEAELISDTNQIKFRLLDPSVAKSTVISFNDIIPTGNVSSQFKIVIVPLTYIPTKQIPEENLGFSVDTNEVYFEIDKDEEI